MTGVFSCHPPCPALSGHPQARARSRTRHPASAGCPACSLSRDNG
ncbi:hypothetical protein DESPIG_00409 [Desulfovibrio piger ATCC 29098]|uniref:Uncharacterized protein n=1 Tax=Desulfovibrio piger ATCC 29098 TaxID=411464 RepID=B6WQT0_9BACT|nr:hypothetical protein DESPIG_00409 [Desulfovibrio piger ATCC 29098]